MIYAIIVAAGEGLRMQSSQRKQFLDIGRRPILSRTLQAFDICGSIDRLIIVVPADDVAYCQHSIVERAGLKTDARIVVGGKQRQDSVRIGLDSISSKEGIVLIHDGVRPLVTEALIEQCIQGARKWGACIPAVASVDTPKQVNGSVVTGTLSRDSLCFAQTPQAFRLSLIRKAHQEAARKDWSVTDDASLVERMGEEVRIVSGLRENIKITTPHDLGLAEYYLSRRHQGS